MRRARPLRAFGTLPGLLCGVLLVAIAPTGTPATPLPAAQTAPRSAPRQVIDCLAYRLTVADLARSVAFYHGVLGLPLLQGPTARSARVPLELLNNTPRALYRSATLALPGDAPALELIEVSRIPQRRLRPRPVDPGATTLVLPVDALGTIAAAASRAGATPLFSASTARGQSPAALQLIDPDGFYVRLVQRSDEPGLNAYLIYTIAEPRPLQRFYQDVLGLSVQQQASARDGGMDLAQTPPQARAERLVVMVKGRRVLQLLAFRGVQRHTFLSRAQDPGAAGMTLRVQDLQLTLRRLRAAGTIIVTAGGQPVATAPMEHGLLVRDPEGLLLELVQR